MYLNGRSSNRRRRIRTEKQKTMEKNKSDEGKKDIKRKFESRVTTKRSQIETERHELKREVKLRRTVFSERQTKAGSCSQQ